MESPPYWPRANGVAERAVRTVKEGLRAWKYGCSHIEFTEYLKKLLFHHRVTSCVRGKSPAQWMLGRSPRVPIVSLFSTGEDILYKPHNKSLLPAKYLMAKGRNTSFILRDDILVLASNNQIAIWFIFSSQRL